VLLLELPGLGVGAPPPIIGVRLAQVELGDPRQAAAAIEPRRQLAGERLVVD